MNDDQEIRNMWQEIGNNGCASELAAGVEKLDRKVFWRNLLEYSAAIVVLVRSAFEITGGDRPLIAPLSSIAATLFIGAYLWIKHRPLPALDPAATASAYREALLSRLDRQIQLARNIRYWYILPVWAVFVVVYISGVIGHQDKALFYTIEFLLGTVICAVVAWLNERYGLRKLQAEKDRVNRLSNEVSES